MKLLFVLAALFIFFFGSVIVMRATEYSFILCDKAVSGVGKTMMLSVKMTLKGIYLVVRSVFRLFGKTTIYRITRDRVSTALFFEQKAISESADARQRLYQSGNRPPVTIDIPPQNFR